MDFREVIKIYKYEFVDVDIVGGSQFKHVGEEHKEIINSYAKDGWRLNTVISFDVGTAIGVTTGLQLVFEKEVQ